MGSSTEIRLVCADALLKADARFVHACARSMRKPSIRRGAIAASWLGNGWIYAGIAIATALSMGAGSIDVIWKAVLSVAILHSIYRPLKLWLSRPRPFQAFPELKPLLPVLDEHSCPSGHAMTLTAVLVTLPAANSMIVLTYLALWVTMAWARIAVAHHYPSDVLAGTALALFVAFPISKI
jgi:undecaprenyl-diphosphatase